MTLNLKHTLTVLHDLFFHDGRTGACIRRTDGWRTDGRTAGRGGRVDGRRTALPNDRLRGTCSLAGGKETSGTLRHSTPPGVESSRVPLPVGGRTDGWQTDGRTDGASALQDVMYTKEQLLAMSSDELAAAYRRRPVGDADYADMLLGQMSRCLFGIVD